MHQFNLIASTLLFVGLLSMFSGTTYAWDNANFTQRINVTADAGTGEFYIILNASNVNMTKLDSCSAMAVYSGGSLVKFYPQYCNSTIAKIWVNQTSNAQVFNIYYGNNTAVSSFTDINVFTFADDFKDASINSTKWAIYKDTGSGGATLNTSDNAVYILAPSGVNSINALYSNINFTAGYTIISKLKEITPSVASFMGWIKSPYTYALRDNQIMQQTYNDFTNIRNYNTTYHTTAGGTALNETYNVYSLTWNASGTTLHDDNIGATISDSNQVSTLPKAVYFSSQSESGWGSSLIIDYVFVVKDRVQPTLTLATAETYSSSTITLSINSPTAVIYNTTTVKLNISATSSANSTFKLYAYLNGTQIYGNDSFTNGTLVMDLNPFVSHNNSYYISVQANDSGENKTSNVTFNVTLPAPTIVLTSNTTEIYITNSTFVGQAFSYNNATLEFRVYLNGTEIYGNTSYANDSVISVSLLSYITHNGDYAITVHVNDSTIATDAGYNFTAELMRFNSTFSNYIVYSGANYSKMVNVSYTARCGYTGSSVLISLSNHLSNGTTVVSSRTLNCDNSTNSSFLQNASVINGATWSVIEYFDPLSVVYNSSNMNYTIDINAPTTSSSLNNVTYGFRSNVTEIVTLIVNDTYLPQTCNISIITAINTTANSTLNFSNVAYNNNASTFLFNLTDGNSTFNLICWDLLNNTNSTTLHYSSYSKKVSLIKEQSGTALSVAELNNNVTVRAIAYDNVSIYDFTATNTTEIYYVTTIPQILRIERTPSGYPISFVDLDFSLISENDVRVCVPLPESEFELIVYASTQKPVWIKNIMANCYSGAGYTNYAYEDALMIRAVTISTAYYLYTYVDGIKTFLTKIDGAVASTVNLDMQLITQKSYGFSITSEDLSWSRTGNDTFLLYYLNSKNDNANVTIIVENGGVIWLNHFESTDPNQFQIPMIILNWSQVTDEWFNATIIAHKTDGTTLTYTRIFGREGQQGLLTDGVAIILASLILFFGLTITASSLALGFFGIIIVAISFAITTLATATPSLRLMQAIIVIAFVFIMFTMKMDNNKVIP